ncbi:metal ABC transporter permease [Dactylosporangium sp. NPDC005555]|uniref:metal ABC transporter permease n=1 Tax=Dactylosporangium sp. NPDC005555 TaxID=3154889 RepID=UPI0033B94007
MLDVAFHRALIEAALVGTAAGLLGVQVVLRRLAFFTMAMTHATFPGVVVAAVAGVSLYIGGAATALIAALAVAGLSRRHDTGTATAVALAAGFAAGVALLSAQQGFAKDLTAYLVGSVLTVTRQDLAVAAGVTAVVAAVLAAGGRVLTFTAFDRDGARAAGLPVAAVDAAVLLLVAAVVVTAVPAAGTILTVALVVSPAGTARLWTDRIGPMTAVAVAVAVGGATGGLLLSRAWDVAAGGAVSLTVAACFGVSLLAAPPLRSWACRLQPQGACSVSRTATPSANPPSS